MKSDSEDFEVAIVGGGITACALSYQLAKRKISHCILEAGSELGAKASGNPVGIFMPVLTAEKTPISIFSFAAFQYFQELLPSLGDEAFSVGLLQLAYNSQKLKRYQKAIEAEVFPKDSFEYLSSTQASELAGADIPWDALYFSKAGFVFPHRVCKKLAQFTNHLETSFRVSAFERDSDTLILRSDISSMFFRCRNLIFASGAENLTLLEKYRLPIRRIRGQIITTHVLKYFENLKMPVCFDGYICPPIENSWQLIGGTYDRLHQDELVRESDSIDLIQRLPRYFPSFDEKVEPQLERASLRSTSPDHLPILSKLEENVFYLGAMGSRGFTYAPLAAKIASKFILNENFSETDSSLFKMIFSRRFS